MLVMLRIIFTSVSAAFKKSKFLGINQMSADFPRKIVLPKNEGSCDMITTKVTPLNSAHIWLLLSFRQNIVELKFRWLKRASTELWNSKAVGQSKIAPPVIYRNPA